MYTLRTYINKSIFGKNLSRIEKAVKTFSIPDKIFSKNSILLCALRTYISKIHMFLYILQSSNSNTQQNHVKIVTNWICRPGVKR